MTRMAPGLGAVLLIAACGGTAPDTGEVPAPGTSDADTAQRESGPDRPVSRTDTIMIEGMPEISTSQLFTASPAHGVPFSTYLPEGIRALYDRDGADDGVRFAAAFTGDVEPEAFMHVQFYAPGSDPAPAEVAAQLPLPWQRETAPAAGACRRVDPPSWGDGACAFDYTGPGGQHRIGRVVVARRGDRAFHVLTHYPAEFGDGLGPRFQRILSDWRWEDTGGLLTAP